MCYHIHMSNVEFTLTQPKTKAVFDCLLSLDTARQRATFLATNRQTKQTESITLSLPEVYTTEEPVYDRQLSRPFYAYFWVDGAFSIEATFEDESVENIVVTIYDDLTQDEHCMEFLGW